MGIELAELLKDNIFNGIKIMAGNGGLEREVNRISVFDCPYHEDILAGGIVEKGDLFISCLEQFERGDDDLKQFLEGLIRYHSAGLLVVPTGRIDVLKNEMLEYCSENNFPVILMRESVPYARIMDTINKYIAVDTINALNQLRIYKIRYGDESETEKQDILSSMNYRFEENMQAIYVKGSFRSRWFSYDFWTRCAQESKDTLIVGDYMIFLLSDNNVKKLKQHANATADLITQYFQGCFMGCSRIHPRKDIGKILSEGERAVRIAATMKKSRQTYEPLLSMQLLLALHGCQEEYDFYESYCDLIAEKVSVEMLPEILRTIEVYVMNSGDFKKTAQEIQQHENTVRYRINRVKQALDMEDDTICFHETIALATKIKILLGK